VIRNHRNRHRDRRVGGEEGEGGACFICLRGAGELQTTISLRLCRRLFGRGLLMAKACTFDSLLLHHCFFAMLYVSLMFFSFFLFVVCARLFMSDDAS
jgi:hypothetical protein